MVLDNSLFSIASTKPFKHFRKFMLPRFPLLYQQSSSLVFQLFYNAVYFLDLFDNHVLLFCENINRKSSRR